ncbi:hypothetical protein Bbelb_415660 [Branchiostoma belcheri]|nr:hypothetical protein Bbelb_415660 [Branchiostoma belcheri]
MSIIVIPGVDKAASARKCGKGVVFTFHAGGSVFVCRQRGAASRDPRSDPAILKQKCVNLMKALVPAKQRLPQRTGSFYIYEGVSGICAAFGVAVACPHRRHADRLSAWWPGLKRQQPGRGKYRPAATDPSRIFKRWETAAHINSERPAIRGFAGAQSQAQTCLSFATVS